MISFRYLTFLFARILFVFCFVQTFVIIITYITTDVFFVSFTSVPFGLTAPVDLTLFTTS